MTRMRAMWLFGLGAGLSALSHTLTPRPPAFVTLDVAMVGVLVVLSVRLLRRVLW